MPTDTEFAFPPQARVTRRPTLSAMGLEDMEAKDESTIRDLVRRASVSDRPSPANAADSTASTQSPKAASDADAVLNSSAAMRHIEAHISDRLKEAEDRIISRVVAALTQRAPGSLHQFHSGH